MLLLQFRYCFLGMQTHTTARDRHWGGDESLKCEVQTNVQMEGQIDVKSEIVIDM